MKVIVRKRGNGASVRIPASVMAAAGLAPEQTVDVREENGRIAIEPIGQETFDIEELVAGITDENRRGALWDEFFDAPGIDPGPREQPAAQKRETF